MVVSSQITRTLQRSDVVRARHPLIWIVTIAQFPAMSAGEEPLWMHQFDVSGHARALAPDASGGIYLAGGTTGSLGGPNAGGFDAFLVAYDSAGNRVWIRQFGTSEGESATALAADGTGGVFIAGSTSGNLGGALAGVSDAWVARFDAEGNQVWLRQFGTSARELTGAVAADGAGGVYVAGSTLGDLGGVNSGAADVFVARFTGAGTKLWVRQFGSGATGGECPSGIASDGAGGVFLGGNTRGSLGGPSSGAEDLWLARYDGEGERLWIRQFDSGVNSVGMFPWGMAADAEGGVFVGGYTASDWIAIAFVARYDRSGTPLWISHYGNVPNLHRKIYGVASDGDGGVLVCGKLEGGSFHTPQPPYDAFLAQHDSTGQRMWLHDFGGSARDEAWAVETDSVGGAYVAGTTGSDAFLARFGLNACYANCDGSTIEPVLTVDDFTCFVNEFAVAVALPQEQQIVHYANCDGSTEAPVLTVDDFTCFVNAFAAGCP